MDSRPLDMSDKPALRRLLSARRNAVTGNEPSAAYLPRLLSLPAFQAAPVICGYMPTRGEPDLLPLWQAAVALGKTYALPVTLTVAQEGRMIFRATPGFCPERLVRGRFGISEPPHCEAFPDLSPEKLRGALMVVPGLGFDREGYRLGYGGGYYDRFLDALAAQDIPLYTVGLCPAVCLVERLPRETHDRAVDTVLSLTDPTDIRDDIP